MRLLGGMLLLLPPLIDVDLRFAELVAGLGFLVSAAIRFIPSPHPPNVDVAPLDRIVVIPLIMPVAGVACGNCVAARIAMSDRSVGMKSGRCGRR